MKIQEAINVIEKYESIPKSQEVKTAYGMAISALEKQVPKKVIAQTDDDREFIDFLCPNCKTTMQQKFKQAKRAIIYPYKHCIECGQALDWSDTK